MVYGLAFHKWNQGVGISTEVRVKMKVRIGSRENGKSSSSLFLLVFSILLELT